MVLHPSRVLAPVRHRDLSQLPLRPAQARLADRDQTRRARHPGIEGVARQDAAFNDGPVTMSPRVRLKPTATSVRRYTAGTGDLPSMVSAGSGDPRRTWGRGRETLAKRG